MGSAPSPPNPRQQTSDQESANANAAQTQQGFNMINQVTPEGSLTYSARQGYGPGQGGTYRNGVWSPNPGTYTATTTLNPKAQALYDQAQANAQESGKIAGNLQRNSEAASSQPLDLSYSALQGQMDAQNRRTLDPLWKTNTDDITQQLYNRGITPGTPAYDSAMRNFQTSKNTAYDQAFLTDQQAAQNALVTQYNSPINASAAWRSGQQVDNPNLGLVQTPQAHVAAAQPAKYAQDNYQAKASNYNAMMGGLFGLGGSLLGGLGGLSDRRDKTDIKKLGKVSGVDMYAYRYKGDPKSYQKVVGPMAPEGSPEIGGHKILGLGFQNG